MFSDVLLEFRSLLIEDLNSYLPEGELSERFWQRRYYSFEIYEEFKLEEKLTYMHLDSVRAGLVVKAVDWKWSSARRYEEGRSIGVRIEWVP